MNEEHDYILQRLHEKLKASVGEQGLTGDRQELASLALKVVREKKTQLQRGGESSNSSLQESINSLDEALKESKEELAKFKKENKNLKEQIESGNQMTQMTVEHILEQQQDWEKEWLDQQEKWSKLEKEREEEQQQWQEEKEQLDARNQELKQELERAQAQASQSQEAQAQQQQLQQQVEEKEQALQAALQNSQELKNKLSEQEQLTQEQQQEVSRIEQLNQELKQQLEELREKKSELERQMREELDGLKQEIKDSLHQEAQVQQGAFRNSLDFTQRLNQTRFQNEVRLREIFPNTTYFSLPSESYNGNLLHIEEKFGVTYLVMVRALFEGLEGQIFKLAANFALNNIIKVKKYINSSKLIEEFFYSMKPSLALLEQDTEQVEIGVCLIDRTNLELEYSSSGFPLYVDKDREGLVDVWGGKNSEEEMMNKRFGLKNTYKVKKIHLLKTERILLSSTDLTAQLQPLKDETDRFTLNEFIQERLPKDKQAFNRDLGMLFDSYELERQGASADFLLARIGF